jgi:ribonucleoside-diphosphate reductase beta chain
MSGPKILQEDAQISLYPIKRTDIWNMYKQQVASFWTVEEVDLSMDLKDFNNLTSDEKHFIKNVLAFFVNSDVLVAENLAKNFLSEIKFQEAKMFYGFQLAMENIHTEMYSLLIEQYIKNDREKEKLVNAIRELPCVFDKSKWAQKYMDPSRDFATRLIAFAVYEGVFFSGSFCAIFWLKKRGLMAGLSFSNELISRDEGLHCQFACLLYNNYIEKEYKLTEKEIHEIIIGALEVEKRYISDSLPVSLIGMNEAEMIEYIKFCADHLCHSLGVSKIYKARNPFEWMTLISIEGKTNFFERRVGEYSKAGVGDSQKDMKFTLDADF